MTVALSLYTTSVAIHVIAVQSDEFTVVGDEGFEDEDEDEDTEDGEVDED